MDVRDVSTPRSGSEVCPWWFIRTFDNPLRRLVHDPTRILEVAVRPGDACLDVGCGIGYFTIPMARLVGSSGSVTALDLQPEMLTGVRRRAERAGLSDRIHLQLADASGFRLDETFDFALMFWMAHEVPDQSSLFRQVRAALKSGGLVLLAEPKGHVGRETFERTVKIAEQTGLVTSQSVPVRLSRAVLMRTDTRTAAQQAHPAERAR